MSALVRRSLVFLAAAGLIGFGFACDPAGDEPVEQVLSGPITADTTVAAGTWLVNEALVVSSGTLTLEPGAILKFADGTSLTVSGPGTLYAVGTTGNEVIFTSSSASPTKGCWIGLIGGAITIGNARIEYAYTAISSGSVTFNPSGSVTYYECTNENGGG